MEILIVFSGILLVLLVWYRYNRQIAYLEQQKRPVPANILSPSSRH